MKKSTAIAVLLLVLLGSFNAHAQLFRFGLKAGPNFADLDGEGLYNTKTKTGFHFGALLQIKAGSNFFIQPEVLYSTQGSKVKLGDLEDEKINYDYVTVPVVLKYYILSDLLSLEAGPQFAFLVNDNKKLDLDDPTSFDFGVVGGLGVDITSHIFVQGRYVVGLTDISSDADVKNRVIQFSVGYKF
ncbi:hypothetical protein FNO01nite_27590 [Flavobacterium noncentrifugens]|uniref:Outer membrane protein beta-barrel domain-containing protein n=1 Tax=Flavobacterium noncentrifugens TaxID=1128970 RepID=A0A1G9CM31_9FLAO|nr:porin family protein [Flavobacterium noncentrifugens]GEP52087.1 hypothetical protein FNO01nite_27590 [Flavobacterium noncentrifugens]SDK52763.1 Outer membrane protein beta-barrel domain-containing protein [Flavobacterium noncentrifugens]